MRIGCFGSATSNVLRAPQRQTPKSHGIEASQNPLLHIPPHVLASLNPSIPLNLASLLTPNNYIGSSHHDQSSIAQQHQHQSDTRIQSPLAGALKTEDTGASLFASANVTTHGVHKNQCSSPKATGGAAVASSSKEDDKRKVSPAGVDVRRDKVAEALRSKPQRGKKRDDLSEKERLELTRTRNREHAKSTRQRKKARYQELLDREEQLLEFQSSEQLQSQRVASIEAILRARQQVLVYFFRGRSGKESLPGMQSRAKSYHSTELASIIEDNFQIESLFPGGGSIESENALDRMLEWDNALQPRIKKWCHQHSSTEDSAVAALSSLRYEVDAARDGIAFSKNGTAYCRVSLVVDMPRSLESSSLEVERQELMCSICHFKFSPDSAKMVSMSWAVLEDHCSGPGRNPSCFARLCSTAADDAPYDRSETENHQLEELKSQHVHPSTVSLDRVRNAESEESSSVS